jgi:nucleolar protein 14
VKKEERGAMRELRRDGAFMAGVRDKEKAAGQEERDVSARRAMSFLQQQESDFKSGGQSGMWKKKKKK